MNWTGGSLQRTKKANRGVLQQQKAYFAKARTQLQNAINPPVPPFRPSYLHNNDDSGLWGMAPFGSGSVRHTGHAAKRPSERTQHGPAPDRRRSTTNSHETAPHEALPASLLRRSPSIPDTQIRIPKDLREGKRRAPEMDPDLQLLEANRKRLLAQQDWVGMVPSKSVSLRFLSSREKSKIGKRRRTTRGRGAAPRQMDNDESRDKGHHLATNAFAHMLGGSGPHQYVDDIQIRIGTDTMENTHSTHLDQYAQSHASSEPMLFDQEEHLAQQCSAKPPVNLQLHAASSASEQARATSRAPSTGEQPQRYCIARRNVASPFPGTSEQRSIIGVQLGQQCQPGTMTLRQNESSTHEFRLTHHVQGGERAFCPAFSGSSSSAGSRGRTASDGHQIGETQPFCDPDSARPSKIEYVHQDNTDREQLVDVEVSAGHAIVDEGPWKTYLAISDGSSHSDTAIQTRSSILHDHPTGGHNNETAMAWSHQATHGQGGQSRISSSSVSASLPSLKRGVVEAKSTRPSGVAIIRRDRPVQTEDEDEKNWRAFVFQSDDNLSLPGMHDDAHKTCPLTPKYSGNASSRCLPLSCAVSSTSPGTYESGSELASDAGYDVPDPRTCAQPSRCRNASPLLSRGFVERLTESEQGDEMLERKVSDEHWVTHASLENNASSGLISSRVFNKTLTSRSLEYLAFAQEPTSSSGRRLSQISKGFSSGWDIAASDDGALHLVDPDKA